MASQLKELIAEAYDLFANYSMGEGIAVCSGNTCCLQPDDAELLKGLPLKQVDHRLIYEFLDAAETNNTPLLVQQIKYLLPRILDLLVQNERLRMAPEFVLNKCKCNIQELWLDTEIEFLNRFALAYFTEQAITDRADFVLEEALFMFYFAGLRMEPLLDHWLKMCSKQRPLNDLAEFLLCNMKEGVFVDVYEDEVLTEILNVWLSQSELKAIFLDEESLNKMGLTWSIERIKHALNI